MVAQGPSAQSVQRPALSEGKRATGSDSPCREALVHAGVGTRVGLIHGADLGLGVEKRCRHDHQQRSCSPTDVEDRRPAWSGTGGLDLGQLGVSNPLSGTPRYGKWSMYRLLPGTAPLLN